MQEAFNEYTLRSYQDTSVYNEVFHLDHIGPLKADNKGYEFILVFIDALFSTTRVSAYDTASCLFQQFGRFGTPAAIHTDRETVFHNSLIHELTRLAGTEAYSKEENGIVESANKDIWRQSFSISYA